MKADDLNICNQILITLQPSCSNAPLCLRQCYILRTPNASLMHGTPCNRMLCVVSISAGGGDSSRSIQEWYGQQHEPEHDPPQFADELKLGSLGGAGQMAANKDVSP